MTLQIRLAEPREAAAIAQIIVPTFRAGTTYAIARDISENDALRYWMAPDKETFVAETYRELS